MWDRSDHKFFFLGEYGLWGEDSPRLARFELYFAREIDPSLQVVLQLASTYAIIRAGNTAEGPWPVSTTTYLSPVG